MKKYVALCATLAALAWAGVAAADTPQGKLTGAATWSGDSLTVVTPVIDGGTNYVGKENDYSGNCEGDSGTVMYFGAVRNIACAHFIAASRDGSGPKMRLTFGIPVGPFTASPVFRISDGGSNLADDKLAWTPSGFPDNLTAASNWVNLGRVGIGWSIPWAFQPLTGGTGFTVTASQT